MPRPFAVIGITFFLTLVMLSYTNEKMAVIFLCLACISIIPFLSIKVFRQQAVFPAACFAVAAGCILFLTADKFTYKPAIALSGENVNFSGTIIELPIKENGRFYYIVKTDRVNGDPSNVKIRLSCAEPLETVPYDNVTVTDATVYVLGEKNEDSLMYFKTTGTYLGAYSLSEIAINPAFNKPVMYYILSLKQIIFNNINELLPNENGGLVAALLLGDKSLISDRNLLNFADIGISHIIAISGLNLSIFLLIFLDIFERLKLNKRIVYASSAAFVILVMALAGFSASVLRAGIMLLILLIGKLINKDADALNSIGLSVLLITAFSPFEAGYIGLQLSVFATLGILILNKNLAIPFEIVANKINNKIFRRLFKFICETVTVTLSASVFTIPITIIAFKSVSLISIISNLLLVYSSTLAMIFGSMSALFFELPFISFISYPFAIISGLLAKYILKCSEILADIPYANVSASENYVKLWLAGSFLILALALVIGKNRTKRYICLSATLCSTALVIAVCSYKIVNINVTRITVADIGNASSTLISKPGHAALIGCGGDEFAANNILEVMKENNVKSLELLLIPRTAVTESKSATDILEIYSSDKIILPELNYDFEYIADNYSTVISKEENIFLWDSVEIKYLCYIDLSCAYADVSGTTILFIFYPGSNTKKIPSEWMKADILICRAKPPADLNCLNFKTIIISGDNAHVVDDINKINNAVGNTYITASNGNILIETRGKSVFSVGRKK